MAWQEVYLPLICLETSFQVMDLEARLSEAEKEATTGKTLMLW